jgi:hypothetical protein
MAALAVLEVVVRVAQPAHMLELPGLQILAGAGVVAAHLLLQLVMAAQEAQAS